MSKKIDARKLDAATQVHLRRSVVVAVREGMTQSLAAKTFGASIRAVNKWVALDKAGGLRALKPKRRGRPVGGGRLKPAQAERIRRQIIGAMPDQLKLPFYLWTRAAVALLIEQEYGVVVSQTTVGRYLSETSETRTTTFRTIPSYRRHNHPTAIRRVTICSAKGNCYRKAVNADQPMRRTRTARREHARSNDS